NFSKSQIEEARRFGQIDTSHPPLSLFWRQSQTDPIPYCLNNRITILAYSPMAQGLLTGKFAPGHRFPKGDHRARNRLFKPEHVERVHDALSKLEPIAGRLGASPGQLALAWVLSQPGTCAIAGARNEDQVKQNAKAVDFSLSDSILAELDEISHMVTDHLDDSPVQWA
ncbi:MAG: aldo/keto reductase, partial [Deltaproteobacteria bacterium]|nr:aldo/keto reductase [Deltaproteobacteria bacterium]